MSWVAIWTSDPIEAGDREQAMLVARAHPGEAGFWEVVEIRDGET